MDSLKQKIKVSLLITLIIQTLIVSATSQDLTSQKAMQITILQAMFKAQLWLA
jgi:hypothetical protein